ncbi:TonB-dependent receptor [Massilia sp. SM-13]|uniref:TonB-dependent receptor n=1 Tax=Pseudoduganella rhizocola TaxID=3382643 RepID=UPI0038B5FBE0
MQAKRIHPLALAVMSVFAAPGHAWAQQTDGAAQDGSADKIETIVVTAQRRLERLQDVPVAVKAFSQKQVEAMGIQSTQDFINLTPNMSFDNSFTYGNSFVVLRGVTQINNADSPVAVVVDGVPQNNQKQLKMNLFDIERIEVLKGPQGALYGRNAIGGAINIETKAPSNKRDGFAAFEAGNGGLKEASAGLGGALVDDTAFYRIVGQTKKFDGLIRNTYTGRNVDAVDHDNSLRARLLFKPAAGLAIDLRASYVDFEAGATWDSIAVKNRPDLIRPPRSNINGETTGTTRDFSAKVSYELPFATLTSISGYTRLNEDYRGDVEFSNPVDTPGGFLGFGFQAGQGQNLAVRMVSQELRLTSADEGPLRWIGGIYYLGTKRDLLTRAFIDTDSSHGQFDDMAKNLVNLNEANDNTAKAAFGQLDYDLAPGTTLSGALRYDRDERRQQNLVDHSRRQASYAKWQPKLTLTRKFNPEVLGYATFSTGFRSGGFNSPGNANFRPETLTNGELGMKTSLLDNRLVLNAAVFRSRSKDFQFFYVNTATASQIISNIDRVNLTGFDVDFRYLPMRGLEFDGGVGYTKGEIRANRAEPSTIGHHTPKNSPLKINLGVQHTRPVAPGLEGMARFDYEYRDKKYWHPDNAAVSPSLNLFGLRLTLRDARDAWSLTLAGQNLGDKRYYADFNSGQYSGLPYDIGSLAAGRTYTLTFKARF